MGGRKCFIIKKLSFVVLLSLFSGVLLAQQIQMTEKELKRQLDSVLMEGNLLYQYERAAWISGDLAMQNPNVKAEFKGYLIYEDQGVIKAIILGENQSVCIAEYSFENSFDSPKSTIIEKRKLSEKERTLVGVRGKMIENIIRDYSNELVIQDGYNLNMILLPFEKKYKLYFMPGTAQNNVIPFGNDYLFIANKNGKIESWKKFHSSLIAVKTTDDEGKEIEKVIHSHLITTPLMTATDICTFKLYAPAYNIDVFGVFSPAIGKLMEYSLKKNEISITDF